MSAAITRRGGIVALVTLAGACAPTSTPAPVTPDPPAETSEDPSDPSPPDDATVDTDEETTETAVDMAPGVRLRVVDATGRRLAHLAVSACREICVSGRTMGNGDLWLDVLPEGRYVVHNLGWPDGDALAWSSFFDFIDVPASGAVDVRATPFVVPRIAVREPIGAGPRALRLAGLELAYDAEDVRLPFSLRDLVDPTIGAVEVDPAAWPRQGLEGVTVRRAWALSPFELTADGGFAVAVPAPAGEGPWGLWIARYLEASTGGRFTRVEATQDGDVLRAVLPELTWVVLGRP